MNLALIGLLILSIVLVVFLISKLKMHAFMAILIVCFVVGFCSGMPFENIIAEMENGIGGALGSLIAIIGLGGILGKLLEESGGANRLAEWLISRMGEHRAHWVMAIVGFAVGIPVFFDVGFVLLIPVIYTVARVAKVNMMYLGIPLAMSLMTVHCIMPPHPAATAVATMLNANIGGVILYSLPIVILTAVICGPLFVKFFVSRQMTPAQEAILEAREATLDTRHKTASLGATVSTIVLPLFLIVGNTLAGALPEGNFIRETFAIIGSPIPALLISSLFAYWSLGLHQGRSLTDLLATVTRGLPPLANVVFIIGAGGAFNGILQASGVGEAITELTTSANLNIIIFAWLVAWVMHFAIGSATLAMISAAGICAPILAADPTIHPEMVAIAIGAGAIGWAHVTDSSFWLVKEFLGVSVTETLKKYTGATVLASVVALGGTLAMNAIVT